MDLGSDIEAPLILDQKKVQLGLAAYQNGTMDGYPIKELQEKAPPTYLLFWLCK